MGILKNKYTLFLSDNSSLSHILSNVHTYYTQFEESVGDNINQLSEPIENGLKVN